MVHRMLKLIAVCVTFTFVGCAEKSGSKTETEVTTPGGSTTTTVEKEVKKTGENPPPATNPN